MIEISHVNKWYGPTFQVFEAFTDATLQYLLVNLVVVTAMRLLERLVDIPGYISGK